MSSEEYDHHQDFVFCVFTHFSNVRNCTCFTVAPPPWGVMDILVDTLDTVTRGCVLDVNRDGGTASG